MPTLSLWPQAWIYDNLQRFHSLRLRAVGPRSGGREIVDGPELVRPRDRPAYHVLNSERLQSIWLTRLMARHSQRFYAQDTIHAGTHINRAARVRTRAREASVPAARSSPDCCHAATFNSRLRAPAAVEVARSRYINAIGAVRHEDDLMEI